MEFRKALGGHHGTQPRHVIARPGSPTEYLSPEEARENTRAISRFIDQIGGKEQLLDVLSVAAEAPEVERIVELLLDPRYEKMSLRRLCAMASLTVVDLFAAYKKAMVVQAHLQAYQVITQKLLPVVEDVMTRAAPYTIPCGDCSATGQVLDGDQPIVCPACHGHKAVIVHPDLDRQKLALELAQLVQKAAGLNIQNTNVHLPAPETRGAGSTLVDLQHAVRAVLSGPRTPILDAEITEATPVPVEAGHG